MADKAVIITPAIQLSMNDTIATIKSLLDLLGIPYPSTAVKSELFALLPATNIAPDTSFKTVSDAVNETVGNAAQDIANEEAADTASDTTIVHEQPEAPQAATVPTYTVESGDTIAGVATRFGMSVGKLQKLNPPLGVILVPGRVLKLA